MTLVYADTRSVALAYLYVQYSMRELIALDRVLTQIGDYYILSLSSVTKH